MLFLFMQKEGFKLHGRVPRLGAQWSAEIAVDANYVVGQPHHHHRGADLSRYRVDFVAEGPHRRLEMSLSLSQR
jgi:hypothetical protein